MWYAADTVTLAQSILDKVALYDDDDEDTWSSLIISVKDGATRLHISPFTIHSWLRRGQLANIIDIEWRPVGRPRYLLWLPELAELVLKRVLWKKDSDNP